MNKEELALFRDLIENHLARQDLMIEKLDTRLMKLEETLNKGKGAALALISLSGLVGAITGFMVKYFNKG